MKMAKVYVYKRSAPKQRMLWAAFANSAAANQYALELKKRHPTWKIQSVSQLGKEKIAE
jgi:hypothetical protein